LQSSQVKESLRLGKAVIELLLQYKYFNEFGNVGKLVSWFQWQNSFFKLPGKGGSEVN
jgi:hypothetical protein